MMLVLLKWKSKILVKWLSDQFWRYWSCIYVLIETADAEITTSVTCAVYVLNTNNASSMWQGINNITGFKGNKPATVNIVASLPEEHNHFFARFEAHNTAHTESAPAAAAEEVSPLSISVADVTRSFKQVNICKVVGLDGIPSRVLRACTFQLAGVFTDIFNLSLSFCGSFMLQKKSTIVPIPKKNKITW